MTDTLAYPVFRFIPDGCRLHCVQDDRNMPHLRPGEWVVLDTEVDQIDWGEVYVVHYDNPMGGRDVLWQVHPCREGTDRPCAWLRPLDRPRTLEEAHIMLRQGKACLSDGPIFIDALMEKIVGKVIGIFQAEEPELVAPGLPKPGSAS